MWLSADTVYLLWTLCGCLAGVQGVAGVLEDFTGATSLVFFPTQAADKEQLGGGFSQRGFGLFGQEVTVPFLSLQYTGIYGKNKHNTTICAPNLKKRCNRKEVLTFILSGVSFISSRFSMLCLLLILGLAPKNTNNNHTCYTLLLRC